MKSYTYSSIFVREVIEAMVANGVDRDELLERAGMRQSMLRNPLSRVAAKYVDALFETAIAAVDVPDWGFRVATYLSENSQRLTTLILFTAPSIRSGLRRAEKIQHLNTTRAWFDLKDEADDPLVYITLQFPELPNEGAGLQMIEASIGAIALYVGRFAGKDAAPGYVSFRHERSMPLSYYERFFPGRELRFGAPRDELGYLRENLDKHSPLAAYNRQVHEAIAGRAEALYQQLFSTNNIEEQVREVVREQLGQRPEDVSLDSVADAMELAGRTLQRRLGKGSLSFNEIVDEERRSVFLSLVSDDSTSFADLARRCGFRSRESLYRSVKRWYGVTPSEYRAQAAQLRA